MFRTHQQSRKLKKTLDEENIPYTSVTKNSLFSLPSIKKIINYLNLLNALQNNTRASETAWWEIFYDSQFSKEDLSLIGRELRKQTEKEAEVNNQIFSGLKLSDSGKIKLNYILKNLDELKNYPGKELEEIIRETAKKVVDISSGAENKSSQETLLNIEKLCEIAKEYSHDSPEASETESGPSAGKKERAGRRHPAEKAPAAARHRLLRLRAGAHLPPRDQLRPGGGLHVSNALPQASIETSAIKLFPRGKGEIQEVAVHILQPCVVLPAPEPGVAKEFPCPGKLLQPSPPTRILDR